MDAGSTRRMTLDLGCLIMLFLKLLGHSHPFALQPTMVKVPIVKKRTKPFK